MHRFLPIAFALAAAAPPADAQAGSYHVYACAAGGGNYGNASWTGTPVAGMVVDTECSAGALIGLRIDGGKAIANGASASLTFTSPPGTTIADFTINRELDFNSNPPLKDTRPLYALYLLGSTAFAGAGDFHTPTRDRLRAFNAWYGYPENDAHLTKRITRLRDMGALAGYKGDAQTLTIQVGATHARRTAPPRRAGASTTCSTARTSRSTTRSRRCRTSRRKGCWRAGRATARIRWCSAPPTTSASGGWS